MSSDGDYCHFTKAIEHLGDRWSLQIIRQLLLLGPQGFNALAAGLPGIGRSILSERLRKLDELGLVSRDRMAGRGTPPYRVTPAGEQLKPVLLALVRWAQRWAPDDPAVAERDPDLIIWWLTNRVDPAALPGRQVVIALDVSGTHAKRFWLVLEPNVGASVCIDDPCLGDDRYVYVEADSAAIFSIARGLRAWTAAIDDGSVQLFGDPELMHALPAWFRGPEAAQQSAART